MSDALSSIDQRARQLEREAAAAPAERDGRRPVVLYGAGPLGRMTLVRLKDVGIVPAAFADGNPAMWGSSIENVPILAPDEAVRRFRTDARFVVTIYNGSEVRRRLATLGVRHVSHFAELYFEHPDAFLPFCGLSSRRTILDAWVEVESAANHWHDERSCEEYRGQLAWRLRLDDVRLPEHQSAAECYFPRDLFRYLDDEVLFDCGAFDGDSLRHYFERCPSGSKRRILAFEPDARSHARLADYVAALPGQVAAGIRVEPWAVAERSGELRFAALGSVRSGVDDEGGTRVTAVSLDEVDPAPTLVKMDVEGFELPALKGASKRLRRERPVLAISLYHHAADLWTIPNYIKSLVPDYNLFLRRYAEDCWELVLYAVPSDRLLMPA